MEFHPYVLQADSPLHARRKFQTGQLMHGASRRIPATATLRILDLCLNPRKSSLPATLHNPLLVSIDIGAVSWSRKDVYDDLGVAMLDTALLPSQPAATDKDFAIALTTRYFIVRRQPRGLTPAPKPYLYGQPEYCSLDGLRSAFRSIINQYDAEGNRRPVFIVGHDIRSDIRLCKERFGIRLDQEPSISVFLDTYAMVRPVFNFHHVDIKYLLEIFDLYGRQKHCSGNDAVYTLQALFLCFKAWKEQELVRQSFEVLKEEFEADERLWQQRLETFARVPASFEARRQESEKVRLQQERERKDARAERRAVLKATRIRPEEAALMEEAALEDGFMGLLQ